MYTGMDCVGLDTDILGLGDKFDFQKLNPIPMGL